MTHMLFVLLPVICIITSAADNFITNVMLSFLLLSAGLIKALPVILCAAFFFLLFI